MKKLFAHLKSCGGSTLFCAAVLFAGVCAGRAEPPNPAPAAQSVAAVTNEIRSATNAVLVKSAMTNGINNQTIDAAEEGFEYYRRRLEMARYLRNTRTPEAAEPILVELLKESAPELVRQSALLELGMVAQAEDDISRAQTIFSQFMSRWPNDARAPEVLLRQGQIFRQMGLNNLALAKFYAVMTSALSLRSDQIDYYQHVVLDAQTEIAETHYLAGKYADAAEFFERLLKQNDKALNRPQAQFRLISSLVYLGRHDSAAAQAQDFITRYPDAPQQPEVCFHLAQSLKQLGRDGDALQQVLQLLRDQKTRTQDKPEVWAYWQQRAGNEIANQFYHDGDYARALDIYLSLAQLDATPAWQLPVNYQIGITYERLLQPAKALDTYREIYGHQNELGTNISPGLKSVMEMARWRADFIQWQNRAEATNHAIEVSLLLRGDSKTNHPSLTAIP